MVLLDEASAVINRTRRQALTELSALFLALMFVWVLVSSLAPDLWGVLLSRPTSLTNLIVFALLNAVVLWGVRRRSERSLQVSANGFIVAALTVTLIGGFATGFGIRAVAFTLPIVVILFSVLYHGSGRARYTFFVAFTSLLVTAAAELSGLIPGGTRSNQPHTFLVFCLWVAVFLIAHRLYERYSVRNQELKDLLDDKNRVLTERLVILETSLNARKAFAKTLSHGTRTPLAGIQFALQLLKRDDLPLDIRQRTLIALRRNAHRLRMMALQMDIAKRLRRNPVPEGNCVALEWQALRNDLNQWFASEVDARQIELTFFNATELHADLRQMDGPLCRDVLCILIDNAVKHQTGGQVVVAADVCTDSGQIRFTVTDRGPRIAPEDAGRLFAPFFRLDAHDADPGSDGLGLGLSLVRAVCETRGGRYGYAASEPSGSQFWFSLPAGPAPAAATDTRRAA